MYRSKRKNPFRRKREPLDLPPLLAVPEELLLKILSYFTYDETASLRPVCKRMNRICQQILNSGFVKAERLHASYYKEIKVQLPRRQSERQNHPLNRHVKVLASIESRLSILRNTFNEYIEQGMCCFIPGKVLDEVFRIIDFLKSTSDPPYPYILLQELRDISQMAMEHFDEKVVPRLKRGAVIPTYSSASSWAISVPVEPDFPPTPMEDDLARVQRQLQGLLCDMNDCKARVKELETKLENKEKTVSELHGIVKDQNQQIGELRSRLLHPIDVRKKVLEHEQKFDELGLEIHEVRGNRHHGGARGRKLQGPLHGSGDPGLAYQVGMGGQCQMEQMAHPGMWAYSVPISRTPRMVQCFKCKGFGHKQHECFN